MKKRLFAFLMTGIMTIESVFSMPVYASGSEEVVCEDDFTEEDDSVSSEDILPEDDAVTEDAENDPVEKVVYFESGEDFNSRIVSFMDATSSHRKCYGVGDVCQEKFSKGDVTEIKYFVDGHLDDYKYRLMDGGVYTADDLWYQALSTPTTGLVRALNDTANDDLVYCCVCWEYGENLQTYNPDQYEKAGEEKPYPYETKKPVLIMFTDAVELCLGDDMSGAFKGFTSLLDLKRTVTDILTRMQTGSAYNMSEMFRNCTSLKTVYLESLATPSVTNMSYMFSGCIALTKVEGTNAFDTSKVTDMSYMFYNCNSLDPTSVISKFDTTKVVNFQRMLSCSKLKGDVTLSNFNSSSAKNVSGMLAGCGINSFTFTDSFDCAAVTDMSEMFYSCSGIDHIDFSNVNASFVTDTTNMLRGCTKLEWIKTFKVYPKVTVEMPENDYYVDETTLVRTIGTGSDPLVMDTNRYISRHLICVEFMPNGGTGAMSRQFVVPNVNFSLNPSAFTYSGYSFSGWTEVPAKPGSGTKPKYTDEAVLNLKNVSKLTLYAAWASNVVEVTYDYLWDNDGDQLKDKETKNMNHGEVFGNKLPLSKRKGYTLVWNTEADGSGTDVTVASTCDFIDFVTLYAIYTPITYQVTFIANGGVGDPVTQNIVYDKPTNLRKNTFTKGNSYFVGWGKTATGTLKNRNFFDQETVLNLKEKQGEVLKLYAIWSDDLDSIFTITYSLNGGHFEKENPPYYTKDSADIILNNPVKAECTFMGWTGTDLDDYTMEVKIPKGSTGDRAYTAHWNSDKFTVKFMFDEKEYKVSEVSFNGIVERPANPVKEGYSFTGWYTEDNERFDFDTQIKKNYVLTARMARLNAQSGMVNDVLRSEDGKTIYVVKGQKSVLGKDKNGMWTSTDKKTVAINKKTGKLNVKKAGMAMISNMATGESYMVESYAPVLSAKSVTVQIGKESLLKLNGLPDFFNVSWQSSNVNVAQVIDGNIIGVGVGKCKIYAYVGGKKYTATAKIVDKGILPKTYGDETDVTIYVKQAFKPKYGSGFNLALATKKLDGKTSNATDPATNLRVGIQNGIVQLNDTGMVIGLNTGKAVVTYIASGVTKRINVTVIATATKMDINLPVSGTEKIKITGIKNTELKWTSENDKIATVDANGMIWAKSVGDTVIFGQYKETKYTISVHVSNVGLVTDNYLSGGMATSKGLTYNLQLPASSSYSMRQVVSGNEAQLVWKSSNTKVATVDEFGTVHVANTTTTKTVKLTTKINGTTVKVSLNVNPMMKMDAEGYDTNYGYKTVVLPGDNWKVHLTMSGRYYVEVL